MPRSCPPGQPAGREALWARALAAAHRCCRSRFVGATSRILRVSPGTLPARCARLVPCLAGRRVGSVRLCHPASYAFCRRAPHLLASVARLFPGRSSQFDPWPRDGFADHVSVPRVLLSFPPSTPRAPPQTKIGKGTPAMGRRHTKTHTSCRRCGRVTFHMQRQECASCGYPSSRMRRCESTAGCAGLFARARARRAPGEVAPRRECVGSFGRGGAPLSHVPSPCRAWGRGGLRGGRVWDDDSLRKICSSFPS